MLAGPSRPAVGFRAEALVLNDTATGLIGRAVWTDDRGDQVFSELTGNGDLDRQQDRWEHLSGVPGATQEQPAVTNSRGALCWRLKTGQVQGQSMGLNGTIHVGSAQAALDAGGPR